MTVYRILNVHDVQCNGRHGDPDDSAIYTNEKSVDRAIRQLNNPLYRSPGAPQPQGRPFHKNVGSIVWNTW
jgi:hypothetical protein